MTKLPGLLSQVSKQQGDDLTITAAVIESNPLNPNTIPPIIISTDRSQVLISCKLVPGGQYILAKLADWGWIGNDYCSIKLPKDGENVFVGFVDQDINSGVIIGRWPSLSELVPSILTLDNLVRKDEFDNTEVWDTNGIEITDTQNNHIVMDPDGIQVTDTNGNTLTMTSSAITTTQNAGTSYVDLQAAVAEVESTLVKLGMNAAQAAVLGDLFKIWIDAQVAIYNGHTHLYTPGSGTPTQTGVPSALQVVMPPSTLSTKVKIDV